MGAKIIDRSGSRARSLTLGCLLLAGCEADSDEWEPPPQCRPEWASHREWAGSFECEPDYGVPIYSSHINCQQGETVYVKLTFDDEALGDDVLISYGYKWDGGNPDAGLPPIILEYYLGTNWWGGDECSFVTLSEEFAGERRNILTAKPLDNDLRAVFADGGPTAILYPI